MDIVIRNGIIQTEETQNLNKIEKKKIHYNNFDESISGPYYDPTEGHLCVLRPINKIKNFFGPQDPLKEIIVDNTSKTTKGSYCAICHKKHIFQTGITCDTLPITEITEVSKLKKTERTEIKKTEINMLKWDRLIYLIIKKINTENFQVDKLDIKKIEIQNFKEDKLNIKKTEIESFEEKIYYYDICPAETKIIKESELTLYQKLRLKYPNYKNELTFIYYNKPILKNYVVVE